MHFIYLRPQTMSCVNGVESMIEKQKHTEKEEHRERGRKKKKLISITNMNRWKETKELLAVLSLFDGQKK